MYSVPAVCRPLLGTKDSVVSMADEPGSHKTYKIAGGMRQEEEMDKESRMDL